MKALLLLAAGLYLLSRNARAAPREYVAIAVDPVTWEPTANPSERVRSESAPPGYMWVFDYGRGEWALQAIP